MLGTPSIDRGVGRGEGKKGGQIFPVSSHTARLPEDFPSVRVNMPVQIRQEWERSERMNMDAYFGGVITLYMGRRDHHGTEGGGTILETRSKANGSRPDMVRAISFIHFLSFTHTV